MQIFCEGRPRAPPLTISGLLALFAVRQSRQSTCLAAQQILPPAANLGNMPFCGARAHIQVAFDQLLPPILTKVYLKLKISIISLFSLLQPDIP